MVNVFQSDLSCEKAHDTDIRLSETKRNIDLSCNFFNSLPNLSSKTQPLFCFLGQLAAIGIVKIDFGHLDLAF